MKAMKTYIMNKMIIAFLLVAFASQMGGSLFAQTVDENEVQTIYIHSRGLQRVGNTFESTMLGDNQTVLVPLKNTLQFDINHRFGTLENGYSDFLGLYAPSNIRLALGYTPSDKMMINVGFMKFNMVWDFSVKYAFLSEKGANPKPFSLTYYGNMSIETMKKDNYANWTDRFAYFHQLMIAKKITRDFSAQASLNFTHFNAVSATRDEDGVKYPDQKNDHFSASLLARYKISDAFAFIGNFDIPITEHPVVNPYGNICLGVELATPLHAFQVFVGNYQWIVPQYNNMRNQYNWADGQFLIGFNITRLIDLQEENMGEMMFKRKNK